MHELWWILGPPPPAVIQSRSIQKTQKKTGEEEEEEEEPVDSPKADLVTYCCRVLFTQTAKALMTVLSYFTPQRNNAIDCLESISSIKDDWWDFPAAARCLFVFHQSLSTEPSRQALIRMRESLPPTLQCAMTTLHCHLTKPAQHASTVCFSLDCRS